MDRVMVQRAQHGDHEAFDRLVTAAFPKLWSVARRVAGDHHTAEDAVQECLLHAWRDLRALRDPDRFEAWLYRLLVNACRDAGRASRRRKVEVVGATIDATDRRRDIDGVEIQDQLSRGFARLSVEHRAALVLHHYHGLTAREIADLLGVPEGTITSRLHYAIRAMRSALEADLRLRPSTTGSENR